MNDFQDLPAGLEGFAWINEPARWSVTDDGGLHVVAAEKTDFFIDPDGTAPRASAHFLHFTAEGDFDFSARVAVDMRHPYDSACLMVRVDDTHWAKLCYEFWLGNPSIVSVVTKGFSDDCASFKLGVCQPYLRVMRAGNAFGLHCSLDGQTWDIVRYFHLDAPRAVQVGFAAQCPVGPGCEMTFSEIGFAQRKLEDARRVP